MRCKELVGWPDPASHHHRGATETSTNYTATEASLWLEAVGERPSTIATRLALWWQSSPLLCHLRMSMHPIGIHREAPYLINLFEKFFLSNVICDTPHNLQTMQIRVRKLQQFHFPTQIEYLFQQCAKYDAQPPRKTMMLNCEQNKAVLTDTLRIAEVNVLESRILKDEGRKCNS